MDMTMQWFADESCTALRPASGAARLAALAVRALIDEVSLSPKPGLVDAEDRGAHADLDWALMCRSAQALQPALEAMAAAAWAQPESLGLRARLGAIGREAERRMMRLTGGVNTHRGAIWALGLLVSAAAMCRGEGSAHDIAARAGALARLPDLHQQATPELKGARMCRIHGVGGARGQAQAGFPQVLQAGLPTLWQWRARGAPEDVARLNALLALMGALDDTCVLARGGSAGLFQVQAAASAVLAAGGAGSRAGRKALLVMGHDLVMNNISPGGSADLLAATLFLDCLAPARSAVCLGEAGWNN